MLVQEGDGRRDAQRPQRAVAGAGIRAGQLVPMSLERSAGEQCLGRPVGLEFGQIPDQGRGVLAGCDDRTAVGHEGHGVDGAAMAREPSQLATRGEVPDVDRRAAAFPRRPPADASNRPSREKAKGRRWSSSPFASRLATSWPEANSQRMIGGSTVSPRGPRSIAARGQESAVGREHGVIVLVGPTGGPADLAAGGRGPRSRRRGLCRDELPAVGRVEEGPKLRELIVPGS